MASLQVGDLVPDLSGTDQSGRTVRLSDFRGQCVVLFFYPKNNTPVCTQEACRFRDLHEEFVEENTVVIGVSGDSEASHQQFADKQRLPYILISDSAGTWRGAFGVPRMLALFPGRVTYVVDPEGRIRHITNSAMNAQRHVDEAREAVRAIRGQAGG